LDFLFLEDKAGYVSLFCNNRYFCVPNKNKQAGIKKTQTNKKEFRNNTLLQRVILRHILTDLLGHDARAGWTWGEGSRVENIKYIQG